MATAGVYAALVNDSVGYIGSSIDCHGRWATHRRELKRGTHHSEPMQRAYAKYGSDSFNFCMVEYTDRDVLLEREKVWIDFFKPKYNISKFPSHTTLGLKHSAETKAKMSRAGLGRKRPPRSDEWRARLSDSAKRRKWSLSDAGRAALRAAHLGNKHSLGIRPSLETRRKLSLARMGNKNALGFKYQTAAYDSRRKKTV